uniref:Phosphoserine phosphatase n=1 Tax=Eptatretus burgeri TaxID=7764 RepID=A0A8C4N3F7_EPTBU
MCEEVKALVRNADAVCFDVDSTVITTEGINELAKLCGVSEAVAVLTRKTMGGTMSFCEALNNRLNLIRPNQQLVEQVARQPIQLTPGIRDLVSFLQLRGVQVFLISGGFNQLVDPVALELGIPLENVYSNRLLFGKDGEYIGFDKSQLTSDSGGKGKVIWRLKETREFHTVIMIGDGFTDLEACPPADAFVGFGGNVIRAQVKEKSKWFVTSFSEILQELQP